MVGGPMKALARATSGLGTVFTFVSTLLPPICWTENLVWQFTQPPGVRFTGTFSKSCSYGSAGATRTRAAPVSPSAFATSRPNCPGTVLLTVSLPDESTWPCRSGGFGPGGALAGGGGGGGGSIAATDHSALTSRRNRPLSSKRRALNAAL